MLLEIGKFLAGSKASLDPGYELVLIGVVWKILDNGGHLLMCFWYQFFSFLFMSLGSSARIGRRSDV